MMTLYMAEKFNGDGNYNLNLFKVGDGKNE